MTNKFIKIISTSLVALFLIFGNALSQTKVSRAGTSTATHFSESGEKKLKGTFGLAVAGRSKLYSDRIGGRFGFWYEGTTAVGVDAKKNGNIIGSGGGFFIFPNPASDEATIYFEHPRTLKAEIAIFDLSGKKINSREIRVDTEGIGLLDLDDLSPGVYFLRSITEDYVGSRILVIGEKR